MAQLYCTGPAHIYVAFANYSQGGPQNPLTYYLGTCEDAPEIQLGPEYEPVRNDITGKKKPFDMQFQGEDALTSLDLNRYNESVYALLAARPFRSAARGTYLGLDVGTLTATEGANIGLIVQFPFASKAAMINPTNGALPPGYYFPYSVPIGPEKIKPGTKAKKVHMLFYSWAFWTPAVQAALLYSTTLPSIPVPN